MQHAAIEQRPTGDAQRIARPLRAVVALVAAVAAPAGMALLLPAPAQAETVTLAPAEARALALEALNAHDPATAQRMARAALLARPDDPQARLILSAALTASGDATAGEDEARRALADATTPEDRHRAQRAVAAALTAQGAHTRAQVWLRRAAQSAPDARARAATVRSYRAVRRANPWHGELRLGVAPSSNINNGSAQDGMRIGGLDFDLSGSAQALSGLETTLGGAIGWQTVLGQRTRLTLGAEAVSQRYRLSGEARDQAPDAEGRDYARDTVEVSAALRFVPERDAAPWDAELTLGHSWYGGEDIARYSELELTRGLRLGADTLGWVEVWGRVAQRLDNDLRSSDASGVSFRLAHRIDGGAMLSFGVGLSDTRSESALVAHDAASLSLGYQLAQPVLGAQAQLSAQLERADYDAPIYGMMREDRSINIGASLFFRQHDLYGFAPVVDLSAGRTDSTIDLYDTRDLGLSVSLRSAF
ncbi:MAG: surface lipoprotein assembly modifier [Celeribacter sp.]|jgi:hypothetical protein